jgi:hypothetical protein
MFQTLAETIASELSGHRAKNHAIDIHHTDRFSSFKLYRQTAAYCLEQMRSLGLEGVESIPCNADGRTPYGDWLVPRAWDAREAVLRVVDTGHVLARYPDVPASLAMYSAATPPGGIESDLIRVDDLAHIPDDFRGKLIWYDGRIDKGQRATLAERGIMGLVFCRGQVDQPDFCRWDNYAFAPRNEQGLFGFSLSLREAEYLRTHCEGGPIRVHAQVDAALYDGIVENVTGYIPGSEGKEEVLVLAHLYEQGANDNASGAGLGLEVMRTLKRLIARGALPPPRRNIRLLLGFECCGFMAYVMAHEERMQRTVAAINPDMVGEDQKLCASSFALHLTPGAAPSCVDALAMRLMADLARRDDVLFRWRTAPYTICDSFIADPTIGVPSVSIIGIPDRYYHSSLDTPDKISPASLDRVGLVLAAYLTFLANAGPREAAWLAEEAAAQARIEIAQDAGRFIRRLQAESPEAVLCEAADRLSFLAERHGRAVASARRFASDAGMAAKVDRLRRDLHAAADTALDGVRAAAEEVTGERIETVASEMTDLEVVASQIIPKRRIVGPLTLEPLMLKAKGPFRWQPSWAAPHNDVLTWIDGQRSVLDIYRCACLESGKRGADLQEIVDYINFLAEHGYVELNDKKP